MSSEGTARPGRLEDWPTRRLLEAAFPFHVIVDRDLRAVHLGRSVSRLCPDLAVGCRLPDVLELVSPGPFEHERLAAMAGAMLMFHIKGRDSIFRCQLVPAADLGATDDVFGLLGSPWVTDPAVLPGLGITLADFAAHDPTPDYMFLAQTQSTALQDAQHLAERLQTMEAERQRLAQAEQALARELNALPDMVLRLNREGEILDFRGAAQSSGSSETVGRSAFDVFPEMGDRLAPSLEAAFRALSTQSFEYTVSHEHGTQFFEARIVRCSDRDALLLVRDVTERRALELELAHQAFHDKLTDLANRALFQERLEQALETSDADGRSESDGVAVLFIDLDNFKTVNDTMGHGAGDELLVVLAQRLRACTRARDTVARFGGDEFAVLVRDADEADAVHLAERIIASLCQPVRLYGRDVSVGASVGLVIAGSERVDHTVTVTVTRSRERSEELLRSADVAMYWAKSAGKNRMAIYEPNMDEHLLCRVLVEEEIRAGIAERQFVPFYQPIVDLATGRMTGVEALVRWHKSDGTLVAPAAFIPVAEETGLIVPIGEMVLREACRQLREWDRTFPQLRGFTVSVNLSVLQLLEPGLVELVHEVLHSTGLEPRRLTLEITETALLADARRAAAVVEGINALGVRLALDDFGTGYSSLSHLGQFPINTIKIDKSFVDNMLGPNGDASIAAALLQMSRVLGVDVVAEGVEQPEQVAALQALHCGAAQGYYFAKPVDAARLGGMLAAQAAGKVLGTVQQGPLPTITGAADQVLVGPYSSPYRGLRSA